MSNPRQDAATTLAILHRKRTTTRHVWQGRRSGAETALVLGALRRRGTLDAILQAHSTRKLHLMKPETIAALRVGLFELLFLDHAPIHAVVNAAVEYVKHTGRMKDIGFVNAILRSIMRGCRRGEEAKDPRRHLPRDGASITFKKQVFPDPNLKPAEFLAARGSTALWIARRRLDELGLERALRCLELQAVAPPTCLRPAPGKMACVSERLAAAGIECSDGPHAALLTIPFHAKMSDVFEVCGEMVVVQDAVASQVAPFLNPSVGARVLDYCAAPGGKATHLAQIVGPTGSVLAWDIHAERLERVKENAERLGLTWLSCGEADGEYDAVLVDAPCSNTGVLARRPEARWRVKEKHLKGLSERQLRILKDAAAHCRAGGTLVYSTCSIEHEENGGVVEAFLARHAGFALEESRTLLPDDAKGDGGFMARLRRV